jgi:hypothetical protein
MDDMESTEQRGKSVVKMCFDTYDEDNKDRNMHACSFFPSTTIQIGNVLTFLYGRRIALSVNPQATCTSIIISNRKSA